METYIVRVYRRGEAGDESLVGTVEVVSTQQRISFRDEHELMSVLRTVHPLKNEAPEPKR